jgi:hypothetical protein
VSRDYRVSPRWVYELGRRFDAEGETGLEAPSRRPRASPKRTPVEIEDEIVELEITSLEGERIVSVLRRKLRIRARPPSEP